MNNKSHRHPFVWFVDNTEEIYSEFKRRGGGLAVDLRMHYYGLKEFAFIDINDYYVRMAESAEE